MTVNRTTLLDLPLPVTGTESGTWGDTTNNGLTQYTDIAIAGMNSLTSANFTAGALTIANTLGDSSATNIAAGSAQYATIKVSSLAVNSTITAPGSNRSYRIINADATYSLTIKASGQTGVTFLPGQTGVVAFNGTDYVIVGVVGAGTATDNAVARFDGTTGEILQSSGVTIDDSNNVSGVAQLNITTLDATNIEVTNIKAKDGTAAASIADSTGVITVTAAPVMSALTASQAVFTTAGKALTSNAITGTGNVVMSASPTLTGTVSAAAATLSSDLTLNGGTANGVVYLNGSKVATSGSALTFDGSNLATTGNMTVNGTNGYNVQVSGGNAYRMYATANDLVFRSVTAGSDVMTLAYDGNVGIGTSSPNARLTIGDGSITYKNSSASTSTVRELFNYVNTTVSSATANGLSVGFRTSDSFPNRGASVRMLQTGNSDAGGDASSIISFFTYSNGIDNGAERMRLDSSGNLGLGVTPSAWDVGSVKALQIAGGNFVGDTAGTYRARVVANGYFDGGWKYQQDNYATQYAQNSADGAHTWFTAPSGTAGNAISFTQAMTLDASGNLGIANTSPSTFGKFVMQVAGTTTPTNATNVGPSSLNLYAASNGSSTDCTTGIFGWQASTPGIGSGIGFVRENGGDWGTQIRFYTHPTATSNIGDITERARITSGGDLLVGTTSQITSEKFGVDSGSGASGKFKGGNTANVTLDLWNPATSGDNIFVAFRTETAETTRGTITYNRAGGLVAYNTTSDYRAKDIIGPVQNPGATIDVLKVYEGKMKGATQSRPMLIAHEAQEHTPYAVTGEKDAVNDDGTPKLQQMDVSSLVPLLLAEIQSLRQRVATLEGTQP